MKLYTIATESHETYGFGDYGTEMVIRREGAYGTGNFPPIFKRHYDALKYLLKLEHNYDKKVVELDLIDE